MNNLRVGVRMAIGFSVIFLLLLAVSIVSVLKITDISKAASDVVDDKIPKIEISSQMLENTLIQARAVRNLILSEDRELQKKQIDIVDGIAKQNVDLLASLDPMIHTEKGRELFQAIENARTPYHEALQTLIQLRHRIVLLQPQESDRYGIR